MKYKKNNVACEECIKAYKLPQSILGKHKERCYWCCIIIFDKNIMLQEKIKGDFLFLKLQKMRK